MWPPSSDSLLETASKPKEVMGTGTLLQMRQDGLGEDGGVALSTAWMYPPAHPSVLNASSGQSQGRGDRAAPCKPDGHCLGTESLDT